MRFLLIDASVVLDENQQPVEPRRPSPSNGSVIGEIGGEPAPPGQTPRPQTVLSPNYPPRPPNLPASAPDPQPDLPPFDIQFDPEGLENIQSVVFRRDDDVITVDNFAPYAVGEAEDGFFQMPPIFDNPGIYTLTAEAYTRDDGEGRLQGSLTIQFRITTDAAVKTELSREGQEREAEAESEVEAEAAASQIEVTGALSLGAAAAATGAALL